MKQASKKIDVFFALLRAGLWEDRNRDRIDGTTDWNEVHQLAQEQSVQGLVLQGIERLRDDNLNQGLLLEWIGEVQMIEQQNLAMNAFVADLIEKLRKKDIYALLVKGQGIAQCYEKPLWRTCGDVDLLLSKDNYEKAKEFLWPLSNSAGTEWGYQRHLSMAIDQWVVELHGTLRTQLSSKVDRLIDETQKDILFNGKVRPWMNGKVQISLPGPDNDVIFIFTHFLKHFYKGGLGLRQICDWCRLLYTYRESLNHRLLESRIKKAGLMTEWKAFGAFAVEILGMPIEAMPLFEGRCVIGARLKHKARLINDFIMSVGNMGHHRSSWLMEHDSWFTRQYVIRKVFSMGRHIGDVINHAKIFPLDSVKFLISIMLHGIQDAVKGEG